MEKIYELDGRKSGLDAKSSQASLAKSMSSKSLTSSQLGIKRSKKVITLVLDFSFCITEVGASQLKVAVNDFLRQVKQEDFVQVII